MGGGASKTVRAKAEPGHERKSKTHDRIPKKTRAGAWPLHPRSAERLSLICLVQLAIHEQLGQLFYNSPLRHPATAAPVAAPQSLPPCLRPMAPLPFYLTR